MLEVVELELLSIQFEITSRQLPELPSNIPAFAKENEEIPDNVIRIETQDGSGDFIEIIFPEENKDKNKNDK